MINVKDIVHNDMFLKPNINLRQIFGSPKDI